MTMTPIRLRAEDAEDLKVVSACLQDAILPVGDMCFQPADKRFVMVVNRFRWEAADQPRPGPTADDDDLAPYERVHCGVRVEGVTAAKLRGFDIKNRGQLLELLSIEMAEGGRITLNFAGGGGVLLEGTALRVMVEDLGEPWPTGCRPCHPDDTAPEPSPDHPQDHPQDRRGV
ncbi:DUF2948 family protein [Azospirillum picis]|uniref:DUF2948 family protein n=1 Tax=Azospirillum picis TaxID=488438 RepID=A0ABU0MII9_9PROT|nr:DUF2948 family protein [Azospirillum picis]MBP2299599.1 hypothetical protein [Azospirillum picis]MDQ0533274.1 hypothetical protein [Azospirillum picis]